MKQGEKLNYAGRVKRRARGSAVDFEIVSDLNPYGIEMALTNGSEEIHRFEVYKKSGGFITDYFDTSAEATTYRLEVSLIIDGVQIAAGNNATVKIEPGVLSKAIGEILPTPTPAPSSEDSGTIESGEWEYLIEVAQSGSEMNINSWSSRDEISLFCFGTVLKGAAFTYNDFTSEQLADLKGEDGKDYVLTGKDKQEIAEIAGGADLSELKKELANKVDKVINKGLSTNDFANEDKSKLDNLRNFDDSDIHRELASKVNKVLGKGLSTNDFTDLLKSRLESTMSAEDINAAIGLVQGELDTLVGGDASSAIDSFNEIKTFLATFTDTQDLASILLALKNEITELIPSIEGLATENYVDQKIGDIDTILDSIITLQETI